MILDVPDDTAVTTPALLTVALLVVELVHTPPLTALLRVTEVPSQNAMVPVISSTAGSAITVIVRVALAKPQVFIAV